jgi:hypothetical protein
MKHFSKIKWLILITVFSLTISNVHAQLTGTYTIGSSGNYTSFTAAVSDLTTNGVSGAVVFNVAPGTYNEQISIGAITGASSSNTITFQSSTGDSTDVILEYASSSASTNNYTLALSGADYITFKSITLSRTGANTYSVVVSLSGGASNNQFYNNRIIGRNYISSSTNNVLFYASSASVDQYNIIQNNHFKYGTYALYFDGSSTTYERGNQFTDNVVDSFGYYGIRYNYQLGLIVNRNMVFSHPGSGASYPMYIYYCHSNVEVMNNNIDVQGTSTNYGVYMYYSDSGSYVTGNKIYCHGTSTAYCINVYYCDGTSSSSTIVANNFLTQANGTGTAYGIYAYNSNYVEIYYNSVNITGGSTTAGRAIYPYVSSATGAYSNVKIYNNILVNTGGGVAIEIPANAVTLGYVTGCDNNDLYVTGSVLGSYNGTTAANLSTWKSLSSLDNYSVSVNPGFTSATDLHATAVSLDGGATPISIIADDIDGESRDPSTPDIGADEFLLLTDDAGIVSFESESPCPGTPLDIKVKVKNYGIVDLDTVEIHWAINDTSRTTYYLNSTIGIGEDTIITIGQFTFNDGKTYNLKFWTENPNNNTDGNNANDTLTVNNYRTAMAGTYLIGSSTGANYATISAAISDIQARGICNSVVFNIDTGTYNEQLVINEIPGSSATKSITFQSLTGDSSKVIITQPSSAASTNNYTVKLSGADYITFKKLTFSRTGVESYCTVLEIAGKSCNNLFSHNQFLGGSYSTTSASNTRSLVYSSTANDTNNIFEYNYFKDNGYAMYYYGNGSADLEIGTIIRHNVFIDQIYGLYLYYQNAPKIYNNTISFTTSTTCYPIRTSYCDYKLMIYNNTITNNNGNGGYGIYVYYCDADSLNEALIYNNFVHLNTTGNTTYGIYPYYGTNQKYYYNSVNVTGSLATSRCIYVYGSSIKNVYLKNNNLVNNATGYAYYKYATSIINESDYNNLYTNGTNLAYWTSDLTSLSALQTASGLDVNSINVKPTFKTNSDLHTFSSNINNTGTPITGFTTDIDGETRSTSTPDIGADEFTPPANDLGLVSILSPTAGCGDSNTIISVVVINGGTNSQTSIPVKVDITGSLTTSITQAFSKTMANNEIDTFTFTTKINTYKGGTYNFVAYTQLSGDQLTTNDTFHYAVTIDSIPTSPSVNSNTVCDSGAQKLAATTLSGLTVQWFSSPTSTTILETGDTLHITNLTQTTTYYAHARAKSNNSITTTFADNNGCGYGNMFNIYAKNQIKIDSFAGNFGSSNGYVRVYYKVGSYTTATTDSTQWTFLGHKSVTPNGVGTPTRFSVGTSLTIPAGNTYGIYIMYDARYTNGNTTFSNNDLDIITGMGFCGAFTSTNADRMWNGTLYYQSLGCASPRTAGTITVVSPASINAGTDDSVCYNGNFNTNASATNFSSLLWQSAGDGSFSSTTTLATTYTPGTTDKTNGTVKLYLTAMGNSPCGSRSDSMMLTILKLPEAVAGTDATICENATFQASGTVNYNNSLDWSTTGSGTFDDTAKINPIYTPSTADITNGSVKLILEASSNCGNDFDTLTLTLLPLPAANAKGDDTICVSSIYTLDGTASSYDSVFWTTTGDGLFSNINSLTSDYTPGTADKTNGSVKLILNVTSILPCTGNVTDTLLLIFTPLPTVDAGMDDTICTSASASLTGTASNHFAVNWSTTGDGVFDFPSNLSCNYTPGLNDIANSSVKLYLKATPNSPCLTDAVDSMMLYFNAFAIADAGTNDTICSNTSASLSATASNYSSIFWTTTGDGTFGDSSMLTTTYTPGTSDLALGKTTLVLMVAGISPCSLASDTVMIYYDLPASLTVVNADSICSDQTFMPDASAANYVSLFWTTNGDGTFNDQTIIDPIYTPGVNDKNSGAVILTLIASSNNNCSNVSDDIDLTIIPLPVVNLGKDTTIYSHRTFNLDAGAGFDIYLWSTNESTQTITVDSNGAISGKKTIWVLVNNDGCSGSDTIIISFIDSTSSIRDYSNMNYVIYPNPSSGKLNLMISNETEDLNLEVISTDGKILINKKLQSVGGKIISELDLSPYGKGVFLIKLFNNKAFAVERIIIR